MGRSPHEHMRWSLGTLGAWGAHVAPACGAETSTATAEALLGDAGVAKATGGRRIGHYLFCGVLGQAKRRQSILRFFFITERTVKRVVTAASGSRTSTRLGRIGFDIKHKKQ